jgi:hypothetical protein
MVSSIMSEPVLQKGGCFTMSSRPARHLHAVSSAPQSGALEIPTCSTRASLLHTYSRRLDVPTQTSRSCCTPGKPGRHRRRHPVARTRCSASRANNTPEPKDLESEYCPRFTIQNRVDRDYTLKNYAAMGLPGLFADDGYLGGGDFEADEFMAGVEVEKDFEVRSGCFQGFVGLSAGGGGARGFDGDCTRG